MLEFVEVSLDQIALAVDAPCDGALDFPVTLGRNVSLGPDRFDLLDQSAGIIASVGDDVPGPFQAVDQLGAHGLVAGLSGRQREADGQTGFIDDGVDLGAQSPARETDGVIRAPFFPPAACWWARMIELSMKAMDSGLCSARALKILIQTPAFAHLLKRL